MQLKCIDSVLDLIEGESYTILGEYRWQGLDYYQVDINGKTILYLQDRFEEG